MAEVRIKGVSHFTDQHGKRRWRFRRKGFKTVMLKGEPGSPEFLADLARAQSQLPDEIGASRTLPGSLSAIIVAYRQSAEWKLLAPATQRMRRNILERFRASHGERNPTPYGDRPVSALEREFLLTIRDRYAATPHQANKLIRVLHSLFAFAVDRRLMRHNPAAGIKPLKVKSDGFHAWTADEIARFEAKHPEGTDARLAFALHNYTGQRRADVVTMGRQHIRDGETPTLRVRQSKTGTELEIPITPPLVRVLALVPKTRMTFLETSANKPYSPAYFGNVVRAWCDEAGLPAHCRAHGIRKAVATRIADEGHGAHTIAAVTGHRRLADVAHYTRSADQRRNALRAAGAIGGTETEQAVGKSEGEAGKSPDNTLKVQAKK